MTVLHYAGRNMLPIPRSVDAKLRKQDDVLLRACEIANSDEDLLAIEREFDVIAGDIAEPWINAPAVLPGVPGNHVR
jgi:hypothetical protein